MRIYQIEVSNLCNLTCSYCPHPLQQRRAGLMTADTFAKALELLVRCGQRNAYLHNFGEPLLHPELPKLVRLCTERGVAASFYTNGVLLNTANLRDLSDAGLRELCVSEHTSGETERVRALIDDNRLPIELSETFRPVKGDLHTWAGQADTRAARHGFVHSRSDMPCIFERHDAAVILWDGRVNVCCIDDEARGVAGTVDDYLDSPDRYRFQPISLCASCMLMRGEEDLS